jgi:hypothetical protein
MPPVISTSGGAHGARSPAMTPVCETAVLARALSG